MTPSKQLKSLYKKSHLHIPLKQFARELDTKISQQWFKNKSSNTRINPLKAGQEKLNEKPEKTVPTPRKR